VSSPLLPLPFFGRGAFPLSPRKGLEVFLPHSIIPPKFCPFFFFSRKHLDLPLFPPFVRSTSASIFFPSFHGLCPSFELQVEKICVPLPSSGGLDYWPFFPPPLLFLSLATVARAINSLSGDPPAGFDLASSLPGNFAVPCPFFSFYSLALVLLLGDHSPCFWRYVRLSPFFLFESGFNLPLFFSSLSNRDFPSPGFPMWRDDADQTSFPPTENQGRFPLLFPSPPQHVPLSTFPL